MKFANLLTIKAEADLGSSIKKAANEAQRLADLLSVGIHFDFNGITCIARPGGSVEFLVQNFSNACKGGACCPR